MNHIDQMTARHTAAREAAAATAQGRPTEQVTVNDLQAGDTITALGAVAFPGPITLREVNKMAARKVAILKGTNGWFTMRPVSLTDTATRVA